MLLRDRGAILCGKARYSPHSACGAHQFLHLASDGFFHRVGERARLAIPDHSAAAFVAAFMQDAHGGNVGEDVVAVACYPGIVPSVLLLETQRIIYHHLATQNDPLEASTELPDLHGIWIAAGEFTFSRIDAQHV